MKSIRLLPAIIVVLMLAAKPVSGQIQITSDVTPLEMVESIVGLGIVYDNVSFTGAAVSRGIFGNAESTNLGINNGIFLTSGSGDIIPGPNDSSTAGVINGTPGDATLNSITTGTTYDAAVLEFDFIPKVDTLFVRYVFGSEEYSEDVGSSYNDVFGLFVTGPNPAGGQYSNKNIALVPATTNTAVKVNSINNGYAPPGVVPSGPGTNSEYYTDNTGGLTLEYDGFTTTLTAWLLIVPFEEYHIKMAIADCGDGYKDSGIFIEENSFSSPGRDIAVYTILYPPGITENMVEGHVEADLVFKLPPYCAPWTIYYTIGGTAENGSDYETIGDHLFFEYGVDSAILHITPLQDDLIEGDEAIVLTVINNLFGLTTYETRVFTIQDYVEMYTTISPNTTICSGDEVELWIDIDNGYPPYNYSWEPGSSTNDTIVVNPEETTTYTVTYSDIFGETGMDSVTVTVFNGNSNNIIAFSFLAGNNPLLPEDVYGTILEDSVLLILPQGQTAENLIASFSLPSCARAFVYDEEQFSGITPNDFTYPVIYQVMAANGELHDWLVVVEIETGMADEIADGLTLFPNPSNGKFYLETNESGIDPIELQIMDLTGRIIYNRQLTLIEKIEIDLSGQPKGIYFLRVKSEEKLLNKKLVIQ